MKLKIVKVEDPKKPTPEELAKANAIVKEIARRKQMPNWENANVGGRIPNIVDEKGNILGNILQSPEQPPLPFGTITDIRKIPDYVTVDNLVKGKDGFTYFEDQNGDMRPIHPDILRSARFNPNRGLYGATRPMLTNSLVIR